MKSEGSIIGAIFATCTAMVGYHIHGDIFWAIMDFIFCVFAWIKWLVLQQVNMHIIRETFSFFMQ